MSWTAEQLAEARANLGEGDAKRHAASHVEAIDRHEITRYWEVNNDKHQLCMAYLDDYVSAGNLTVSDRVTAPQAQRDTYPGVYVQISNSDTPEKNRYVSQTLRRINTITDIASLAARPALVTNTEQIIRPFGFTSGDTDTAAHVFYDIDPASKAACLALTPAELVAEISGAAWTYTDRSFQIGQDGIATFAVQFRMVEWLSTWSAAKKVAEGMTGYPDQTQTHVATGLPDESDTETIEAVFEAVAAGSSHTMS